MDQKIIENSILFTGMDATEIKECLQNLHAYEKSYKKGTTIMYAGHTTRIMGLVVTGSVTIESNDIWGNKTILSNVGANGFFAETYAIKQNEIMLVDVCANEDSTILFLTIGHLFTENNHSTWKTKLIKNLLMISTQKNLTLSRRSFHTSLKSARGRILSYLNSVSLQKHSSEFDIPFNRQQLADYLNLERTNMSKELGKMKRDGIIEYHKNHFILKDTDNSTF